MKNFRTMESKKSRNKNQVIDNNMSSYTKEIKTCTETKLSLLLIHLLRIAIVLPVTLKDMFLNVFNFLNEKPPVKKNRKSKKI